MFIWTTRTILVFGQILPWYGKTLPKKMCWGKVTFWDYRENELIHWRYILKSSPMLGSTPQGLLFLKNNNFWNFETCPFWRNCIFAHIWSLRRPSGGFQKASPSSLEATGGPDQSWKGNLTNSYVFFCRKWRDRVFRLHGSEATCTKYRACAQKLSAVFANGAIIAP